MDILLYSPLFSSILLLIHRYSQSLMMGFGILELTAAFMGFGNIFLTLFGYSSRRTINFIHAMSSPFHLNFSFWEEQNLLEQAED